MEKYQSMTPLEALDDFILHVFPKIPLPRPKELYHARYGREGRGTYTPLGDDRIERLLNKYAPGRYRFERSTVVYVVGEDLEI